MGPLTWCRSIKSAEEVMGPMALTCAIGRPHKRSSHRIPLTPFTCSIKSAEEMMDEVIERVVRPTSEECPFCRDAPVSRRHTLPEDQSVCICTGRCHTCVGTVIHVSGNCVLIPI